MPRVVAGLISDQSQPRTLFLYLPLSSRVVRLAIRLRYDHSSCTEAIASRRHYWDRAGGGEPDDTATVPSNDGSLTVATDETPTRSGRVRRDCAIDHDATAIVKATPAANHRSDQTSAT